MKSERGASAGQRVAVIGFILFAAFAPHSIAAAEIALAIAATGWLIRTVASGRTGFRRGSLAQDPRLDRARSPADQRGPHAGSPRGWQDPGWGVLHTKLDLPVWLFFLWTFASAFLSTEPGISVAKLQSVCVLFLLYLTRAVVTRRTAVVLVSLMILSGVAGTLGSIYDLVRGRGVIVESVAADSPFRQIETGAANASGPFVEPLQVQVEKGDTIWRIGGHRIYSVADIDEAIKKAAPRERLPVSVITHGEQAEWPGFAVADQMKVRTSPSGLTGTNRLHRFRASGWTRHYEYFAEILQILAQLSLGLALANFQNHGANRRFKLALIASGLLAFGIAFTAMRTVLVAFAIGGCVVVWRAAKHTTARFLLTAAIAFVLGFGAVVVWETRATNALSLQDKSSSLRARVARVGLSRLLVHPVFGHGMDAVKEHWTEWGFPGNVMIHLHSTPLQIAFDRGLPALVFWLWIMIAFWLRTARGERATRDLADTNRHGVLLGATGALAGFFASSLVNYNFGAGIVALVFWWLMGTVVVLTKQDE